MKITLTPEKVNKITTFISALLVSPSPTIREVAQAIGYIVSSLPAVKYGKCHHRAIENNKISSALKEAKGNFDSTIISTSAVAELEWWVNHLPTSFHFIQAPVIDCAISSDASLTGWGGAMNNISTGGHWQPSEAKHHINYLERLAAYFVLKFFIKDVKGKHIKIMIDNTTAVSVINNMGTCHSYPCNSIIACKIWTPCEENRIWLTAAHIPGKEYVTADYESRYSNLDTEWMLNPKYLSQVLEGIPFTPVIDLFASRINKQFDQYVSYRPYPFASYIDAFTISWTETKFYCFPPFSCILRVVRNIIRNKANGVLVVPQWPTRSWYTTLLAILEQPPVVLPPAQNVLLMPSKLEQRNPLHKKLRIAICLVSGANYR